MVERRIMGKLLILSEQDVRQLFTLTDALEAVEGAYRQKAEGTGIAWPMVYAEFDPGAADMDIRAGDLRASGVFGLKLTSWFSQNPQHDLPEIYGTTLICSDTTGEPLALLNASAITGLRTGAAGALGLKWLGRRNARTLVVAGAGAQSTFQVAAALVAVPTLDTVLVWDPVSPTAPVERVERMRDEVAGLLADCNAERVYRIEAVANGEQAVRGADAVVTITPARTPIIQDEWVRPGTHLSCVGADMPGKQEVASAIHARARLFADDIEQSVTSGELEIPCAEGAISRGSFAGELGQVIAGMVPGRTSDDEVTVFDTSGIAVQDLASSSVIYERARTQGIGTYVEL